LFSCVLRQAEHSTVKRHNNVIIRKLYSREIMIDISMLYREAANRARRNRKRRYETRKEEDFCDSF